MKNTPVLMLNVERGERNYSLLLPLGAPYGEAYDVVFEMLRKVLEMSNQAVEAAKPKENSDVALQPVQPADS